MSVCLSPLFAVCLYPVCLLSVFNHKYSIPHPYLWFNVALVLSLQSLGQLGRVMNVFGSGDCRVKVNGYMWTLNPKALVPAPGESPPDVPGMTSSIQLQYKLLMVLIVCWKLAFMLWLVGCERVRAI